MSTSCTNILLILLLIHLSPVLSDKLQDFYRIATEGTPLISYDTVSKFFTSEPIYTHAFTNIRWCPTVESLVLTSEDNPCSERSYHWTWLMGSLSQPSQWYLKVVLMIFSNQDCKKLLSTPNFYKVLARNNYNTAWLGFRTVLGPNADDPGSDFCPYFDKVTEKQVLVVMFNERPLERDQKNPGYSEEQLCNLFKDRDGKKATYVALDALYLSATSFQVMRKCIKGTVRVFIYQMDGQKLPNPHDLYQRFQVLRDMVRYEEMQTSFLPPKFDNQYKSNLPRNNWQHASNTQGMIQNQIVFNTFLAGYPLTLMNVWTIGKRHLLNDKTDHLLQIPLQRALPYLSKERSMVLEFQDISSHHLYTHYEFALNAPPIVILRVAPGPNYDKTKHKLVDLDNIILVDNVQYALGFGEQAGQERYYSYRHIYDLVTDIRHPKFWNRSVGIYLAVEFLEAKKQWLPFEVLCTVNVLNHITVSVGQVSGQWSDPNVGTEALRNIKWFLRKFDKESLLVVDYIRNWQYYLSDPSNLPPIEVPTTTDSGGTTPPTVPTTESTSTPGTTNSDTEYTAQLTTTAPLNTTRFTFTSPNIPYVMSTGGGGLCIKWGTLLSVLGYLLSFKNI